jgi:hypothetical protein
VDTRLDDGREPAVVNGEEFADVLPCSPGLGIVNANGELMSVDCQETTRVDRQRELTNNRPAFH